MPKDKFTSAKGGRALPESGIIDGGGEIDQTLQDLCPELTTMSEEDFSAFAQTAQDHVMGGKGTLKKLHEKSNPAVVRLLDGLAVLIAQSGGKDLFSLKKQIRRDHPTPPPPK